MLLISNLGQTHELSQAFDRVQARLTDAARASAHLTKESIPLSRHLHRQFAFTVRPIIPATPDETLVEGVDPIAMVQPTRADHHDIAEPPDRLGLK